MSIRNISAIALPVLAVPLAIIALITTPNEYTAMGQSGVDCDGPFGVLVFALPALVVYVLGIGIFAISGFPKSPALRILIAAPSLIICGALGIQIALSIHELQTDAYQETCGSGL
ncbi:MULTISPECIES: hypothetical protein [Phyllobacterium]|uniref:hypothetical protein n=1 Tax=Phyllobacterium TaxID=28100 RepID=UPI003012DD3E